MKKEIENYLWNRRKIIVLEYARFCGNNTWACRAFDVPRSTFYDWKKIYLRDGEEGLMRKNQSQEIIPGNYLKKL